MNNLMPFDEINALKEYLIAIEKNGKRINPDEAADLLEDLLIVSYVDGVDAVNEAFGIKAKPDSAKLDASIRKKVGDDTAEGRVRKYAESGDIQSIIRVIETDSHRVYNAGAYDTASSNGVKAMKKWVTARDDKVRDTHDYLEGVSVPLESDFYTYDSDHAPYPGAFEKAENNVNCRCGIDLTPA